MNAVNGQKQGDNPRSKTISFPLGQIVATPSALELLDRSAVNAAELLQRHQSGDWGNVPPEGAIENDMAVIRGCGILSSYSAGSSRVRAHLFCVVE